jgi:hypothetical protein
VWKNAIRILDHLREAVFGSLHHGVERFGVITFPRSGFRDVYQVCPEYHTHVIELKSLGSVDAADLIEAASIIGPKAFLK